MKKSTLFIIAMFTTLVLTACSGGGGGNSVVTLADVGGNPDGVTVAESGNIYITDISSGEIIKVNEDGTSQVIADVDNSANNLHPDGIVAVTDNSGKDTLYVAVIGQENTVDGKIVEINADTGNKTDLTTGLKDPSGIAADEAGNLYVVDGGEGKIYKIDPENASNKEEIALSSGVDLESPHGLTLTTNDDGSITLYTTDQGSNSNNIVEITLKSAADKTVIDAVELTPETTGGFEDGTTDTAKFKKPHGITTDKNGAIFVADEDNNRVAIITPSGNVINFAGTGTAGDSDGDAEDAKLKNPRGMATLPNGDVLICDYGNGKVKKVIRD